MQQRGFTLVEMSIVLVIIGLLVGGVLSGQSLIHAAELRSVSSEYTKYVAATNGFRDKYQSIPGDFRDATRFWGLKGSGAAAAGCTSNSSASLSATGACDGDGNGQIANAAAASASGETYQYWNQLALSGLIEGTYTGLAQSGAANDSQFGINVPRSKFSSNTGWSVHYAGYTAGSADHVAGVYGNFFAFGAVFVGWYTDAPSIKPEDAWNIDTKLDDGNPMTGKVIVVWWNNCANATSASDTAGTYRLTNSNADCGLYFTRAF